MDDKPSELALAQARNAELKRELGESKAKVAELEGQLRERNTKISELHDDILNLAAEVDLRTRESRNWRNQAEHDMLTDLWRRGVFVRKVSSILRGRREDEVPGSCLAVLDVDDFKSINDKYGHPMGDEVLKSIAVIIANMIRVDDLACRIGDEYLIFFNGASKDSAHRVIERIVEKVKSLRFGKTGKEFTTSVSFGIALRKEVMTSYEELYHEADDAMYNAKRARKAIPN